MGKVTAVLLVLALSAVLCGCTSKHNGAYPAKMNAVVIKCENNSSEWCLYVTMTLPSTCYRVKYDGMSVKGNEINVYFTCSKADGVCTQVLTKYSKSVKLGNLKGDYSVRIYVNGEVRTSFSVNFSG